MTTPNTQPIELDKAIEHLAHCQGPVNYCPLCIDSLRMFETTANRLKEVEKERDEFEHKISHLAIVGATDTQFSTVAEMLVAQLHRWRKEEQEELTALRTGYKQALETSRALIKRMRVVYASPEYQAVWSSYMIHGGDYSKGPKWVDEFDALEALLSTPLAIEMMKGDQ